MEHQPQPLFKWLKPGSLVLPQIDVSKPDEINYEEEFSSYLGDKTCLSSSGMRKLLVSPRRFLAEQVGLLDDDEDEEKDCYRFGTAAHMAVLEPERFRQLYVIAPEFSGLTKDGRESTRSKDAQQKKEAWYKAQAPGALILTEAEMNALSAMIESLMMHPQASMLLKNGRPEVTGRFTHEQSGVRCRVRPDYICYDEHERLYVVDIKTTRTEGPGMFATDAAKKKYFVQLALYYDGIAQILKKPVEQAAFIVMEKNPPYEVHVYWLDEGDLKLGRIWYEHAIKIYKKCLRLQEWPGTQTNGELLRLPFWQQEEPLPSFEWSKE